ncbi:pseudouridine synthase [candidate division TA06 bacterium]|uniref:Pseudouridine synthase n=1 Tax=candidate division TA06 bacterium TaxID=2250710 RepID=A0A933IAR3_UNCT6|nr:pseudouridine synthase [candidate division TA06 bacterium]
MLIAFNKPYGVLSQFIADGSKNRTLVDFGFPKCVYPLGRLDADSEGLLLLSDEPELNAFLLSPKRGHSRTYWAQVENIPSEQALKILQSGIVIEQYETLPCSAMILSPQPEIAERNPPIRVRKNIPACWIEITLTEGKNRQVRRMTAAIGFPTLRLVRMKIGSYRLGGLKPGQWKPVSAGERKKIFNG